MSEQQIRTAVVGAGAIGGLIAAAAVRAGHDVSVLARGKTLDAIRADGVRIVGDEGETVACVVADDDAAVLGVQDFVVVALKAQALPAVAASLRPMIGPKTVIVAAMNGLPWWFLNGMRGPLAGQHIEAVDPGGMV
jgi:2-dehydropantoate 2-reductase